MSTTTATLTGTSTGSGALPVLLLVQGNDQTKIPLEHTPFSIGRKTDKDLVLADARVSRDHAHIVLEGNDFFLVDLGSKHGTFVNGQRVDRHKLQRNDRMEFGAQDRVFVVFHPDRPETSAAREFLSQISVMSMPSGANDLEKMKIFLEAARKLNTSGVLDEVLVTLIDATLRLAHAERGFVFLKDKDGGLRLAAGRNSRGELLLDDKTISHSILEEAVAGASEFVVTDTSKSQNLASRNSIVAYDLRTVICIPLRRTSLQQSEKHKSDPGARNPEILGVLYMDSRFASREISVVSTDILHAIATEAAALVENAHLVQAETAARQYQQELAIAAFIQQRLMTVTIPEVPFAAVRARNLSCREIGGDFYDAILTDKGIAVVLTDVCGKGVSAAILGSILQGMIYSQLSAGHSSLMEIVSVANKFLCLKSLGEKYATMVVAHMHRDGALEMVNCGHVPPLLVQNGKVMRPKEGNLPVGLLPIATYESATYKLNPGDKFILVTDGVTEAEDMSGEFFGNERLEASAVAENAFEKIFADISEYCGTVPLNDDCTVLELSFKG
jgi:phosphoserine phosphatase RsbU/P